MASPSLSTLPTITSPSPLFPKTSSQRFKISCNGSSENQKLILPKTSLDMPNVDRRNLLVGLGGLYGATNLPNIGSALAYPITAPDDITHCVTADDEVRDAKNALRGVACCPPPLQTKPDPYEFPEFRGLRFRRPAQRVTPEYIKKYQDAIAKMKDLPDDDPRSWKNQAKIHCAYCNGAYTQEMNDHAELKLQVHSSWLFFPFHRWYLYFYERILGKLIDDPTFALPYWNWDNPTGMMFPSMFEDPVDDAQGRPNALNNPLFDPYRNVAHLPPAIVDLQYSPRDGDKSKNCLDQIDANLATMHTQMVTTPSGNPDAFFGSDPNNRPDNGITGGSIEGGAHTAMHIWVGNPRMTNNEDMGNFYSAGYDPAFYCHHANVDRMWKLWKDIDPSINKDPTHEDWLNASYVFYDENKCLVRVYNKDCVDIRKMGYDYESLSIPWINTRPVPRVKASKVAEKSVGVVKKVEEMQFPLKLSKKTKVLVKRPVPKKRSQDEKKKAKEMLFLKGVKFDSGQFFKLDVLVDDVDDGVETTAASSEFAGTISQVPQNHGLMTSGTGFGITELLEDIEAEDDEYVVVTLVPKAGTEDATIADIKVELVPVG